MPLLHVKNVIHDFGGLRAVNNYNLQIEPGQVRGLIGPNGAGKTTIFNLLTGIYRPSECSITLDGHELVGLHPQDGNVAIVMNDREGRTRELSVLSVGDFFGEMGLIDESPRSATASCRTDCRLTGFFRPDLFELIEKDPRLGIKIVLKLAEIVAERLRNALRISEDFAEQVLRSGAENQPSSATPSP